MLLTRVMAAFAVVVVAIAAARLAIFGLIVALLVGVLGLYLWMSLALASRLASCAARQRVSRTCCFFLPLAALFLQVLLLTSILSSREV